ncbi:MAG: DUF6913 domain-containing protein [Bacteroidales bacterium]
MRGFLKIRTALGNQLLKKKKKQTPRNRAVYNFDNAKSVGILFDANHSDAFDSIIAFYKFLKKRGIKSQMLGYVEDKELPDQMVLRDNCEFVSLRDIDLWLRPKNEAGVNFMKETFDILFDLSLEDYFTMHYISTLSVAKFKVGRYKDTPNDYDFMINIDKKPSVEYLIEQIEVYVEILNKTST